MKKVLYIVKSQLNFYPPCVTQIRLLKKAGVDIEVLYGSCTENVVNILNDEEIPSKKISDVRGKFSGRLDKLNNYLTFRFNLKKELRSRDLSNTILWFGNAETLLTMKGALKKYEYAITFLELLDDKPFRLKMLKPLAQNASFNLACEETRAYIMRNWWRLDKLPYVMPNKPYDNPATLKNLHSKEAENLLSRIGDKKIIIYQGIIKEANILKNIAEAMNRLPDDYVFLLMGPDFENIVPEILKISPKVIYSGYIAAPNHLQVTGNAYIGIVYYKEDITLNRAYCAPNKIYEYSAFGMPMLANNIPGLKNTVGLRGAAFCTNLTVDNIVKGVEYISSNYDAMNQASQAFYKSTDLVEIMNTIIQENLK